MGKTFRSHERFDDEYDEYEKKQRNKAKKDAIKDYTQWSSHHHDKERQLDEMMKDKDKRKE